MAKPARTLLAGLAVLFAIPLADAGSATAASVAPGPATVSPAQPVVPQIHALDCNGGTGSFGCGPGFHWQDGWRGFACYPC